MIPESLPLQAHFLLGKARGCASRRLLEPSAEAETARRRDSVGEDEEMVDRRERELPLHGAGRRPARRGAIDRRPFMSVS